MIKNFRYNDIVLYSKGWYKRSDDICEDLGYLFRKIYGWTPTRPDEVADFMLTAVDRLYEEKKIAFDSERCGRWNNSFHSFNREIKQRMSLYNVSWDMAIIYWALNVFSQLTVDEIQINPPVYGKKEHFRMGRLFKEFPISMTYAEMNRIAQRTFKPKEEHVQKED